MATAIALIESYSPHVFCLDILPNPAEDEWKVAQKTAEKYGSKLEYRQLDITNEDAVDATFESIYTDCQVPIGAFFGAAGIQQRLTALEYPAKDFRKIMEVNVTGGCLKVFPSCRIKEVDMIRNLLDGSGCCSTDAEEEHQGVDLSDRFYVWFHRQQR